MTTTTVKIIGTGGDYTTLQAWEDACPANLVTNDEIWNGKLKNQTFTSANTVLSVAGVTTDATRFLRLQCDTGASFSDHADRQTNALRYNTSNGAAIECTGTYKAGGCINATSVAIDVIGIQLKTTQSNSYPLSLESSYCNVTGCIVEGDAAICPFNLYGSNTTIRNSLIVNLRSGSPNALYQLRSGARAYGCTSVALGGAAAYLNTGVYGAGTLQNCAAFGVSGAYTGTTPSVTTCYTELASPPTGFTQAAFSTSSGAQFESITSGSHDLRIKTGSSLKDAGTTDTSYGTPDIVGTARPSGSAYDVGAWEYVSAGVTFIARAGLHMRQSVRRASVW